IRIAEETGSRLHVAHLSSKAGLEAVREAKEGSGSITCEVCPHHLFLTENDIEKLGNFGKMNPPLRSKEDVKALWKGLNDGTIDCVSTDHAPHTIQEKSQPYDKAPSGVPGVETMLPLLLNAVREEKIELKTIMKACAENPARIFGFNDRARLEEGFLGDAVIVNPEKSWTIRGADLLSKCGWTPFEGISVKGRVEKTIVGGGIVFGGTKKPVVQ
ncbi:MAG: dihydroorotase family protein, partial [archaeon]